MFNILLLVNYPPGSVKNSEYSEQKKEKLKMYQRQVEQFLCLSGGWL